MRGAEALLEYRRKVEAGEIERATLRNPTQRWQEHNTRKMAIDAFCWQCMGATAEESNGARAAIKDCPSHPVSVNPCPL